MRKRKAQSVRQWVQGQAPGKSTEFKAECVTLEFVQLHGVIVLYSCHLAVYLLTSASYHLALYSHFIYYLYGDH